MIERLIMWALTAGMGFGVQVAVADPPPKGATMREPAPGTGSLTQLAEGQADDFEGLLESIRTDSDAHSRIMRISAAIEMYRAEADAEGYALELMGWATSEAADRRRTAVQFMQNIRDANLLAMLISRAQRPDVARWALASLKSLAGPKAEDAAEWKAWFLAGGRPW